MACRESPGLRSSGSGLPVCVFASEPPYAMRSEEHTSELQSPDHLVCRLLLEKKKINNKQPEHQCWIMETHIACRRSCPRQIAYCDPDVCRRVISCGTHGAPQQRNDQLRPRE